MSPVANHDAIAPRSVILIIPLRAQAEEQFTREAAPLLEYLAALLAVTPTDSSKRTDPK
jgi:hypothetical protein